MTYNFFDDDFMDSYEDKINEHRERRADQRENNRRKVKNAYDAITELFDARKQNVQNKLLNTGSFSASITLRGSTLFDNKKNVKILERRLISYLDKIPVKVEVDKENDKLKLTVGYV